jgi:muramoyltetrapeptide carboxypeptidase
VSKHETLKAPGVPRGATIGIVTPATPAERHAEILAGIEWWEAQGYRVKLSAGALERAGDFAGTPEVRARDLQTAFADPEVAAIQCTRGGYGSAEVVPLLDFEAIGQSPKFFVGFSDITALHAALLRFTGLVTFYGPSLTSLAVRPVPSLTGERLLRVLAGETTGPVPQDPDGSQVRAIAGGRATGRLVGGCLSDVMHTFGTPWELDLEGAIFFFEEVGASPQRIDRHLLHFQQAGKLRNVAGVVIGELAGCGWDEYAGPDWPRARTLDEVLEERLGALGVPVLYGFPVGHGTTIATLPLGVDATLDADSLALTIDGPALA